MINVLHLTASFGLSGGAETNLLRLVCHMDRSRFRNTVVTMTDLTLQRVAGLLQSQLAKAGVPVYSLGYAARSAQSVGCRPLLSHRQESSSPYYADLDVSCDVE